MKKILSLVLFLSITLCTIQAQNSKKTFTPDTKCSFNKGTKSCVSTSSQIVIDEKNMTINYGRFTEKYDHGELKSSTQLEIYNKNETVNVYYATPKREKVLKIHIQPIIGNTIIYSNKSEKDL